MQSTVKVPVELGDVFSSELATTAAEAAQAYAEAQRLRPDDVEACKADLDQALELEAKAPGAGEVTGPTAPLAATARGVLLELVEELSLRADDRQLDVDRITGLADSISGWAVEVGRLEAEGGRI